MKQVRWFRVSVLAAVTLMSSLALAAQTVDLAGIQQKLKERITLATLDGNGEIATAGSVVTLQKSSLQMCATTAPANAGAPANTYKNGKLSAGMFSFNFGLGLMKIDPNSIPMHTSVAGEKFWIVLYNVRKNGVEFKLWTDPDSNNIRYWSWLEIPIDKKQNPSADEVMKTIAEVIAVEPAPGQGAQPAQDQGGQQAAGPAASAVPAPAQGGPPPPIAGEYTSSVGSRILLLTDGSFTKSFPLGEGHGHYVVNGEDLTLTFTSPYEGFSQHLKIQSGSLTDVNTQTTWARTGYAPTAAPPAPMPDIAPPPPPADTPPPTISLGQTMDQVTAGFGQPLKVAKLGVKTIFYYKEMKITFTNGKVSNVD